MLRLSRVVVPAAVGVALLGPTVESQQPTATPKFAYINSQMVLSRAPGRAEAEAVVAKERTTLQATGQRLQDSLNAMIAEYTKVQATLTQVQKDQREKAIGDKRAEFDARFSQLEQQAQQRQVELVQPIMNQIREVLDKIRTEEGFTFIFDVAGEGGTIVAADKNLDITDRVVARLKPIPVTVTRTDSSKGPAGAKPAPAGITKPPTKPPTR